MFFKFKLSYFIKGTVFCCMFPVFYIIISFYFYHSINIKITKSVHYVYEGRKNCLSDSMRTLLDRSIFSPLQQFKFWKFFDLYTNQTWS